MHKLASETGGYGVWIKIADTLPWIELEQAFQTKSEAQSATRQMLNAVKIKIVNMSTVERESERYVPLIKIRAFR
jgi:hypothetical protein